MESELLRAVAEAVLLTAKGPVMVEAVVDPWVNRSSRPRRWKG